MNTTLIRETETPINPDHFRFDGMYLMYYIDGQIYHRKNDNEAFIARFKYKKPWRTYVKQICKHFNTIEEYLNLMANGWSPVGILRLKGYRNKAERAYTEEEWQETLRHDRETAELHGKWNEEARQRVKRNAIALCANI